MYTAKETAKKILNNLPEDSSMDEIIRELAFEKTIQRGLEDSKHNRIISEEDLKKETLKW